MLKKFEISIKGARNSSNTKALPYLSSIINLIITVTFATIVSQVNTFDRITQRIVRKTNKKIFWKQEWSAGSGFVTA